MKIKELLTVLDTIAYLNIVTEKRSTVVWRQRYFITSDLLERAIKLVDIIRNEFLLQRRINKWTYMKE